MKFSIKDFFSKCDQIRSFLRIGSDLLKKIVTENLFFVQWVVSCTIMVNKNGLEELHISNLQNHESHLELKSCESEIDSWQYPFIAWCRRVTRRGRSPLPFLKNRKKVP